MTSCSNESWDYIVVGAGSAGCVVAARLAEDRDRRVLLLDAGNDSHSPLLSVPAGVRYLIGNARFDWGYSSEPDASRAGRPISWSAGKVVGGGSAINGMVFNRGLARDYDAWEALGCAGWSAAEVTPVFAAMECFTDAAGETRGRNGPQSVEFNRYCWPLVDSYLEACRQTGIADVPDINAFPAEGVGHAQASTLNGRRCSTRDAYLAPWPKNLELRSEARATELVIAEGRCRAVRYQRAGEVQTVNAGREVIVCAGTFGSAQLLMLSGVGEPSMLQRAGVVPRLHLAGVGANLQDHSGVAVSLGLTRPGITRHDQRPWRMAAHALRWLLRRDGVAAGAAMLACGYARSSAAALQPDLYLQLAGFGLESSHDHGLQLSVAPALTTVCSLTQPRTRGRLELAGPDPVQPLRGHLQMLGDPADCETLLAGVRLARRIHDAPALRMLSRGERLPGAAVQSDSELLGYLRAHVGSQYHPVGSCRMGSDEGAVVDAQLRLRGIQGLRVADASVMPQLTSANTNAPVIMIAERAAQWVRRAVP